MKTPEEIEKEIAAINDRVDGWAYRVTDYKTGKLKTTIEDITENLEAAASEGEAPAAPAEEAAPEAPAADASTSSGG